MQELCGSRALGCYSGDEMVSLGEPARDGTTPEEVVRHEYGHHVAWHRREHALAGDRLGPEELGERSDGVLARLAARGVSRGPGLELRCGTQAKRGQRSIG